MQPPQKFKRPPFLIVKAAGLRSGVEVIFNGITCLPFMKIHQSVQDLLAGTDIRTGRLVIFQAFFHFKLK
jgi:hypothetical protein